ncbi:MAG: hypothetical protein A2583_03285 [Bdellovibrionales bacterium RIFOXYD1_FULL_53_11]|nr:MAG: hypothetical protein A2583_03285 [Bdellovibrionales bacterium RIFOXYD1_FULL_53_11]
MQIGGGQYLTRNFDMKRKRAIDQLFSIIEEVGFAEVVDRLATIAAILAKELEHEEDPRTVAHVVGSYVSAAEQLAQIAESLRVV